MASGETITKTVTITRRAAGGARLNAEAFIGRDRPFAPERFRTQDSNPDNNAADESATWQ
jgi:hypothetical protein